MLTLRFTALVVIVAGAPSFWYLILYGMTIQTILPDIGLLFRGMLSLIQVMTVGLSGLILTGISAAIYALIVHDRR
jgi:tetrahydromethanopterin S-methyltransferase subunit C